MRINNPFKLISQPKILLYCFFVGSLIWFFNELNNRSNASMLYPINFNYDNKEELIEVIPPPNSIEISINGTGWNLLRNLLKLNITEVEYNINKPSQTKFILSNSLLPYIAQSLENVNVNFVVTDSIFINIEKKINKELKVLVDTSKISIADNFQIVSDFALSHDKIYVEGPQSIINSLPNTYFINTSETSNLSSDFNEDFTVEIIHQNLSINPEKINLSFNIEEFVQEEIILKVDFYEENFLLDTSVVVLYKIKKGVEISPNDSLYVTLRKEEDYLIPEVNGPDEIQVLNISPNSFILDK